DREEPDRPRERQEERRGAREGEPVALEEVEEREDEQEEERLRVDEFEEEGARVGEQERDGPRRDLGTDLALDLEVEEQDPREREQVRQQQPDDGDVRSEGAADGPQDEREERILVADEVAAAVRVRRQVDEVLRVPRAEQGRIRG